MDAGRRLKILGSETKDLLPIEVAETRKSAFFLGQFSKPQFPWDNRKKVRWHTHNGLHYRSGALNLGKLNILK